MSDFSHTTASEGTTSQPDSTSSVDDTEVRSRPARTTHSAVLWGAFAFAAMSFLLTLANILQASKAETMIMTGASESYLDRLSKYVSNPFWAILPLLALVLLLGARGLEHKLAWTSRPLASATAIMALLSAVVVTFGAVYQTVQFLSNTEGVDGILIGATLVSYVATIVPVVIAIALGIRAILLLMDAERTDAQAQEQ